MRSKIRYDEESYKVLEFWIQLNKGLRRKGRRPPLRLDVEPARLGSAQLELARYDNELARLGSLLSRAKRQARLGSFSGSSWLIWLASQLEK